MRVVALCVFLLVGGCGGADQYLFRPVAANARVGDQPAAAYWLPVAAPRGEVRVTSLGEREIRPAPGAAAERAIEVRLVVDNSSDAVPWSVDTRRITLTVAGAQPTLPAVVQIDGARPPIVSVPRGAERTIDLYFPLPPAPAVEGQVPAFDVIWQVRTGAGVIARDTRFLRRTTSLRESEQGWTEEDLEHSSPTAAFWRDDW